jgi:hypothetical protein
MIDTINGFLKFSNFESRNKYLITKFLSDNHLLCHAENKLINSQELPTECEPILRVNPYPHQNNFSFCIKLRSSFFGIYFLCMLSFMIITNGYVHAQSSILQIESADEEVLKVLGFTIHQAIDKFGVPNEVFPFRASEAWMDTVVFYWSNDHFYLFFWDNRVWQIRFDKRFKDPIMNIEIGMNKSELISRLGQNFVSVENQIFYKLPFLGYPCELRLAFEKDILNDIYIFRSDF